MKNMTRLLVIACLLQLTGCGGGGAVVETAGMFASLKALQSALSDVNGVVQHADDATKDRLADVDTRMQSTMRDIDDLMKRHEARGEEIAVQVLDKAFNEGNEELFNAGLAVQDAQVDLNQTVSNALVNSAMVISQLPFTKTKPFTAMIYPTVLLPDTASDYDIKIIGFYPDELGKPEFRFPDGTVSQATVGADNRLHLPISRSLVNSYKGKTVNIRLKYKTRKRTLWEDEYAERDVVLTVLPSTVIDYKIHAEALPESVYDHPVVLRDAATSAGAGEETARDVPFGFNDLTTDLDFVNMYDKSNSSIEQTIVKDHHGNNPTGDNYCNLPESSGQRVVIRVHAHGKPGNIWGNGAGADDYCKVAITLKLARKQKAVPWHFKNGIQDSGSVKWGGDVELFPEGDRPLASSYLDITDYTYDPAQHRTLSLTESYRSKFVQVNNTATRVSIVARSLPRLQ